jgi:hypothetical protein
MYESGRRAGAADLLLHPPAAFLRNYILRRGFSDGAVGLTLSLVNSYAVLLKFAKLWEMSRTRTPNGQPPTPKHEEHEGREGHEEEKNNSND